MYLNSNETIDMMSVRNIFRAFKYWPRIFQLLWENKNHLFYCYHNFECFKWIDACFNITGVAISY
ncbi:hypothetical protein HMSSN139_06540 [Paenibacillus sp. HMSSN-139]|nr:hypothetical protein HMSSN139_06540 [Paenibacillus sp. HMSSN-139]